MPRSRKSNARRKVKRENNSRNADQNSSPKNQSSDTSPCGKKEIEIEEKQQKNPLTKSDMVTIEQREGGSDENQEHVFFGYFEFQLSDEKETNVKKFYKNCSKKSEHGNFISMNTFSYSDVDGGFQDQVFFEHIKATADLTVCVTNNYICSSRKIFYPFCHDPYPLYETNGGELTRIGSGRIWFVRKYSKDEIIQCRCMKCRESSAGNITEGKDVENSDRKCDENEKIFEENPTAKDAAGEIWVHTANQIVGNSAEAQRTTCRLFYDSTDSQVVNIYGSDVVESDRKGDKCMMRCVTCDAELLDQLQQMLSRWRKTCAALYDGSLAAVDVGHRVVIVAHPHGGPKKVSVGKWTHRKICKTMYDTCDSYAYSTSTCPGCSGAPVIIEGLNTVHYGDFIHCGTNYKHDRNNLVVEQPEMQIINFSGRGRYY